MQRNQFTFYASFYNAIARIRNKSSRVAIYDALCAYALEGIKPDLDKLPDEVAIVFELIQPNIRAGLQKARARMGQSKEEDTDKIPERSLEDQHNKKEGKNKGKGKKEREKEKESENECLNTLTLSGGVEAFEAFWNAYPKQVERDSTLTAFRRVDVPVQRLLTALEEQKRSAQWLAEGGRYIPKPAAWLERKSWEDRLPVPNGQGLVGQRSSGPSGALGPEELANIQRLLQED